MNRKKLQRMLELSNIKPINESKVTTSTVEHLKKASDGNVYAIIRENRKYFIKITDKKQNLNESDFNYIGGVSNKPKYSYNSYEDAIKHMNLMFDELNRLNEGRSMDMFESDTHLLNEKKYVLRSSKPKSEPKQGMGGFDFGDSDSDSFDFGDSGSSEEKSPKTEKGGDSFDFGSSGSEEDLDFGDSEDEEGTEDMDFEDEEGDPIKSIQKLTGKLGQKLRDTEDMSSDMQKWVAKSVLAALELGDMDTDDKKDLIRTIKSKKHKKSEDDEFSDDFEGDKSEDSNVEESYDSYMDDDMSDFEKYGNNNDMPLSQVDMSITDKSYLNPNMYGSEDSDEWYNEMEGEGFFNDNYIDEDDDKLGGERYDRDELLFDEYDSYMDDNIDVPFPRNNRPYGIDRDLNNDYDLNMSYDENLNPIMSPSPAPSKPAPTKEPSTKPGKPSTDKPATPSRRPFTPPPHITPGEEPGPKADNEYDSYMDDDIRFEY